MSVLWVDAGHIAPLPEFGVQFRRIVIVQDKGSNVGYECRPRDGEKYPHVKPNSKVREFVFPVGIDPEGKGQTQAQKRILVPTDFIGINIIILLLEIGDEGYPKMMDQVNSDAQSKCNNGPNGHVRVPGVHKGFEILHILLSANFY